MPSFFKPTDSVSNISVSSIDKKWARERYGSSTKFFFKFESSPIQDNVTGRKALVISPDSANRPFLEPGAFGQALRMRPQSVVQYNVSMPDSLKEFSLGFWLQPVHVSPSVNSVTGELNYYRLALIDKASFIESGEEMAAEETDQSFVIYEECRDNGKNTLTIQLRGTDNNKYEFVSEEYSTGEFHYFWITFNGTASIFSIYIDGKKARLDTTDSVPEEILVNMSVPFHINKSAFGYRGLLRGNFGLLDELIFQTEYAEDGNILSRHINYGSENVVNDELLYREETFQVFAYDDPTTVDIKTVCSNGTNIYAGRSDGKLFKGDRTMWEVSRNFSNRDEIGFVKKNILSDNYIIDVSGGALKISKASIRI